VAGLAVSADAGSVAHGIHYALLGLGLAGLVALLAPGRTSREPGDEHSARVQELRRAVAAGTLGRYAPTPLTPPRTLRAEPPTPMSARIWLPLAVVSCTAAAGVHAAVGPAHFREQTVLGLFFAAAALGQMAWSLAVVTRAIPFLLRLGAAGNASLVALWAVTRTTGLPGVLAGVLPRPEAVGPWDLACVGWELLAVLACVEVLLGPDRAAEGTSAYRVAGWKDWDGRVRAWAWISVIGLGLLSISGAGS
jgi:hypothetical protein